MTTFDTVNRLIEQPVTYTDAYLKKDLDKVDDIPVLDEMALKPKANNKKQITTYRILSILSLIFCLFVITTEATVIYDPQYTLMYLVSVIED